MSVHTRVITPGFPIMHLSLIREHNQDVHSDTLTPTGGSKAQFFLCVCLCCVSMQKLLMLRNSHPLFLGSEEGRGRGEERQSVYGGDEKIYRLQDSKVEMKERCQCLLCDCSRWCGFSPESSYYWHYVFMFKVILLIRSNATHQSGCSCM